MSRGEHAVDLPRNSSAKKKKKILVGFLSLPSRETRSTTASLNGKMVSISTVLLNILSIVQLEHQPSQIGYHFRCCKNYYIFNRLSIPHNWLPFSVARQTFEFSQNTIYFILVRLTDWMNPIRRPLFSVFTVLKSAGDLPIQCGRRIGWRGQIF